MSNISFPNAKINLGLHVVAKRNDGYHDLETVFYPIRLCDALEFTHSPSLEFQSTGLSIDGNWEDNLVVKAWRLLNAERGISPVSIHLHKTIPTGAGIGGGSADAAFMLVALNHHFSLGLDESQLMYLASKLGSDCAFFVRNKPCFATGRGEQLQAIDLSLSGKHIVLVNPGLHISTREAFGAITPGAKHESLLETISRPITEWKDSLVNDFEKSIFPQYPAVKNIKDTMYKRGALYASMSGSGSSVYGIFDTETDLSGDFPGMFVWKGIL